MATQNLTFNHRTCLKAGCGAILTPADVVRETLSNLSGVCARCRAEDEQRFQALAGSRFGSRLPDDKTAGERP